MKTSLVAATLNEIEAVQAVLPQIDKSWVDEIIITDGGSTDGTVEYCKEHGYTVVQQKGKGYGSAIQEAVKVAKGDIIIEFPPDGNSSSGPRFRGPLTSSWVSSAPSMPMAPATIFSTRPTM